MQASGSFTRARVAKDLTQPATVDVFRSDLRLARRPTFLIPLALATLLPSLIRWGGARLSSSGPLDAGSAYSVADYATTGTFLVIVCVLQASTIAYQLQAGNRRQRFLDGQPLRTQVLADGATLLMLAAVAQVASVAVVVGAAQLDWVLFGGVSSGVSLKSQLADGLLSMVCSGLLGVSVGTVIGLRIRSTTTAAVTALGCTLVPIVGALFATSLSGFAWLYAIAPTAGMDLAQMGLSTSDTAKTAVAAGVSLTLWPLVAYVLARREPVHDDGRSERSGVRAVRRWSVVARNALIAAAGLVVAGYLVPVALRDEIPWPLRPVWIADKAHHEDSLDIAKRYLDLVRGGEVTRADALSEAGEAQTILGPYFTQIAGGSKVSLSFQELSYSNPGAVQVHLPGGAFTLCEQRLSQGWRITAVSFTGTCANATLSP